MEPVTLLAPANSGIFRKFTLSSGNTFRPTFLEHRGFHRITVEVKNKSDLNELLTEGWELDPLQTSKILKDGWTRQP